MAKENEQEAEKPTDVAAFLFLAVFLAPAVTTGLIGSYGLLVWLFE